MEWSSQVELSVEETPQSQILPASRQISRHRPQVHLLGARLFRNLSFTCQEAQLSDPPRAKASPIRTGTEGGCGGYNAGALNTKKTFQGYARKHSPRSAIGA